jgi:hypothetical protein
LSYKWLTPIPTNMIENLFGVWVSPSGKAFIVGNVQDNNSAGINKATIICYQPADTNPLQSWDAPTFWPLYGVWGTDDDNVFAVGEKGWNQAQRPIGGVIRYKTSNNGNWKDISDGFYPSAVITSIWGSSISDYFAVTKYGKLLYTPLRIDKNDSQIGHYSYGKWKMQSGNDEGLIDHNLNCVYGYSNNDVYIVGDAGVVLHYNRKLRRKHKWDNIVENEKDISNFHFFGVWCSSPNDVYIVGTLAKGTGGCIFHYDGNVWNRPVEGFSKVIKSIWGFGPNDIFAVGEGEIILHYDGKSWVEMASPGFKQQILYSVSGAYNTTIDTKEVYAVGSNGTIFRCIDIPGK